MIAKYCEWKLGYVKTASYTNLSMLFGINAARHIAELPVCRNINWDYQFIETNWTAGWLFLLCCYDRLCVVYSVAYIWVFSVSIDAEHVACMCNRNCGWKITWQTEKVRSREVERWASVLVLVLSRHRPEALGHLDSRIRQQLERLEVRLSVIEVVRWIMKTLRESVYRWASE